MEGRTEGGEGETEAPGGVNNAQKLYALHRKIHQDLDMDSAPNRKKTVSFHGSNVNHYHNLITKNLETSSALSLIFQQNIHGGK